MERNAELYINLLKKTLSFSLWPEPPAPLGYFGKNKKPLKRFLINTVIRILEFGRYRLGVEPSYSESDREGGEVWPSYADTMIGINGRTVYSIPHDRLIEVLKKYNRIQ